MSTLALAPALLDSVDADTTLDELLVDAWEGLAAGKVVRCPVCRSEMLPVPEGWPASAGGRCDSCGSELS